MARIISDVENKLLIMHIIDAMGELKHIQLIRFLLEVVDVNYIDASLALGALEENGDVALLPTPAGMAYRLTPKGQEELRLFSYRIPNSRLESVREATDRYRERFRLEQQLPADFISTGKDYQAQLRMVEGEEEPFRMVLSQLSREDAENACERWPAVAPGLYLRLMSMAGEGENLPIRQTLSGEFEASLSVLLKQGACTVRARFPVRSMAERVAGGWQTGAVSFADAVAGSLFT